ncbi:hypothetical protein Z968_06535 [Clostridium novyi A str. 4552]|uniref:Uncharacterized protein n=1 Tax=Clostridium novyi A str. 4552 TaxID=1444289 RepID=A0A0A0I6A2_CLONO|nr:AAA family ATPase [Clostridium novyi]KGM96372.1 hypothetical protein Z968_06535 [Clostridium novyi A str. 4552]
MKLHYLKIEGFRKHLSTEIYFSDTTFLIGQNNIGKSTILKALEYLLKDEKKIKEEEYLHYKDINGSVRIADEIIFTAEFRDLPEESLTWRGFKGRVLKYDCDNETGLKIVYRKRFKFGSNCEVQLREYKREKKQCFKDCKTLNDFINNGIEEDILISVVDKTDKSKKLTKPQLEKISKLDELYDFNENDEVWFTNPGGIPGNVLSKLPKYLLIPAQDKIDELNGNSGTLVETMKELFNEVRDQSENYKKAQKYLEELAKELDPNDEKSELGCMIGELNNILGQVFPDTGISATATLSDANQVIKPQFNISMYSNVETNIELQGTGMIRAAVFGLLRYKNERDLRKEAKGEYVRPIVIGFEEPEIYLHPNAAMQMRETIYSLAATNNNQIVCTTHSPYMIDLSKKPNQVLNSLSEVTKSYNHSGNKYQIQTIQSIPFNITDAYNKLQDDEKHYVKMLLKIDDYIAKAFFVKNVLIVEGDTEEIVLKETINRLPNNFREEILCNWQIIKARGKAAIIPLIKYLKSMGIEPHVMHDKDEGVEGAEKFNVPIRETLNSNKVWPLENCIEDVLGYNAPKYDKPYKAFKYISENWKEDWESISNKWKEIIEEIWQVQNIYNSYDNAESLIASDTLSNK